MRATTTRRRVLLSAAAGVAAWVGKRAAAIVPQTRQSGLRLGAAAALECREFDLADVTLLPGPFRDNMSRDLEYLASFDCDRLLAPFEQVAGLPTRAPSLGGWESQGLASHYCGHYLSAAAMMHAHTRDPRLESKVDYLLPRLAACQEANGRADPAFRGYCTGIPQSKPAFRQVLAGRIDVHDPHALYSFSLNGLWSPWYTVHKVMAGLRDVWLHMGRAQARDILLGMTDWAAQFPGRLSVTQMQTMLVSEQGGMNEVLADVHAMTGEETHRTLAQQFNQAAQLAPLMRHEDILTGQHSNQYIPRVIGIARQYELTGSSDYRTGAEFFWRNVVRHRSFVFGGHGDRENFFPIGDAWRHLSAGSAENCCTYNILKLTNHYFCWNASMEAADFYERARDQSHSRLAGPGDGRHDLLPFDAAGTLQDFLVALGLVLVLRRHGHGESREVFARHLLSRCRYAVGEPLPGIGAALAGERAHDPPTHPLSGVESRAPADRLRASGARYAEVATPLLVDASDGREAQRQTPRCRQARHVARPHQAVAGRRRALEVELRTPSGSSAWPTSLEARDSGGAHRAGGGCWAMR